jgi:hypothetical protein
VTAREALAAIRERAEAATEGPWEWVESTYEGGSYVLGGEHPVLRSAWGASALPKDATFIAHTRTDVPALVGALEAVLGLHQKHPYGSEFSVKRGWAPEFVCKHCASPMGGCVPWPCPTVQAIETALEPR